MEGRNDLHSRFSKGRDDASEGVLALAGEESDAPPHPDVSKRCGMGIQAVALVVEAADQDAHQFLKL